MLRIEGGFSTKRKRDKNPSIRDSILGAESLFQTTHSTVDRLVFTEGVSGQNELAIDRFATVCERHREHLQPGGRAIAAIR
jgi:hypothetical protein